MKCQNCGKPHNGNYVTILGLFKLCQPCQTARDRLHHALTQGVTIDSVDPRSGNQVKTTYKL